jgi:hypothetical protein
MTATLKPFHESIVDAIKQAELSFHFQILAQIIKTTKIPKGHDEILAAWERQISEAGLNNDLDVIASVLEQKQAEEKKAAEKAVASANQQKGGS